MTTTTYYMGKEGLEEVSSSEDTTNSSFIWSSEVKLLGCKSKRELTQMYLNGEITADQLNRWIDA